MPFDGVDLTPVQNDLELMKKALRSISNRWQWRIGYGTEGGYRHCILSWLNVHAGEHFIHGYTGYRIAEQRLYPELPEFMGKTEIASATSVMMFNDMHGWRPTKRLLQRSIARLEASIEESEGGNNGGNLLDRLRHNIRSAYRRFPRKRGDHGKHAAVATDEGCV